MRPQPERRVSFNLRERQPGPHYASPHGEPLPRCIRGLDGWVCCLARPLSCNDAQFESPGPAGRAGGEPTPPGAAEYMPLRGSPLRRSPGRQLRARSASPMRTSPSAALRASPRDPDRSPSPRMEAARRLTSRIAAAHDLLARVQQQRASGLRAIQDILTGASPPTRPDQGGPGTDVRASVESAPPAAMPPAAAIRAPVTSTGDASGAVDVSFAVTDRSSQEGPRLSRPPSPHEPQRRAGHATQVRACRSTGVRQMLQRGLPSCLECCCPVRCFGRA